MRKLLLLLIQAYRYLISPLLPARCRYLPTCSDYALQAITEYGVVKGAKLTLRRLIRCHPWGGHGYDPVPQSCCSGAPDYSGNANDSSSSRPTVQ